ncbi:hypothetical protein C8C77_11742 [Halanaerobium saccharolyticum]|uniref:Uncharacterized protein n=1 Tax=Halanaerobium saccharolyticum TaxID=43595 RepID=A0A4V3G4W1_9FIRM|nr:hypothetical protein [Halanaerobium saccharolyticum]RAK07202.1 hypothetical protein C7958_11642 [Halanaerobium saccharolyticum]TDW02115.1 hypothetical protein C8C77_11742 [Halanaerobium saccharolyticum]TDX58846.1 hypothetical protein C7956_11742 [Halanaerobium saccharolyticum]
MIKHIDPETELLAAALPDLEWNINLLKNCGDFLDWISIHEYWDMAPEENNLADYEQYMAYTKNILRDTIIDVWSDEIPGFKVVSKIGESVEVESIDLLATKWSDKKGVAVAAVNKDSNDINRNEVKIKGEKLEEYSNKLQIKLKPHSVNIIQLK